MALKKQAAKKRPAVRRLINEGIEILQGFGVPLAGLTDRRRDMASMCFLAVAGVTHSADWSSAGSHPSPPLRTREIIDFINKHFGEQVSRGSYDDIRRKHLKFAVLAGVIQQSAGNPGAAANDPTRGYGLSPEHSAIINLYGQEGWGKKAAQFMATRPHLSDSVFAKQSVMAMPLVLPNGSELKLGPGSHNALQRSIIEQFRPRFAPNTTVLYLGDAENKELYMEATTLASIGIELNVAKSLPDVVLLDSHRKWLFLIEAVHSFGPISPERLVSLNELCKECNVPRVFVTAFLDRTTFRKFAPDIAWETDVWIAEEPDHMIHFNGDRFFGPRESS
ncbi:type II restriction enzyme [Roseimicrobium gellanilyticum]|uniref:Type II restriction enzyme n=1 Tax=Roseimicrobium gellanilyticum TaxID=748857 RepID=A0A366HVR6_9BACT|nr:BsuBI/PstI family type II restriction endonuclease [Roseimicrobium gellanilyticum]RBP47664.1 type II restriction enzyme [Roseimicrobium gellanilyticum]